MLENNSLMSIKFYLKKEACVTLLHFTWHSLSFRKNAQDPHNCGCDPFSLRVANFIVLEERKD